MSPTGRMPVRRYTEGVKAMLDFPRIFDIFSTRPEASTMPKHEVPVSTRNRILLWCGELFGGSRPSEIIGRGDHNAEFWQEVHRRLLYRTGRLTLTASGNGADPREAVVYVLNCPGPEFLKHAAPARQPAVLADILCLGRCPRDGRPVPRAHHSSGACLSQGDHEGKRDSSQGRHRPGPATARATTLCWRKC
jgi:hypothetical protein